MNNTFNPLFLNYIFPGLGFFQNNKLLFFILFLPFSSISIVTFFTGFTIKSGYLYHLISYYILFILFVTSLLIMYRRIVSKTSESEKRKLCKSLFFNIMLPGLGFFIIKYKRKVSFFAFLINGIFLYNFAVLNIAEDVWQMMAMSLVYLVFHYAVICFNFKIFSKNNGITLVSKRFIFIVILFKFINFDAFFHDTGIRSSLYFFKTKNYFSTISLDFFTKDPFKFSIKKILVNRLAKIDTGDIIMLSDHEKDPLLVKYFRQDKEYIYATLDLNINFNDMKQDDKIGKFNKNEHKVLGEVYFKTPIRK